MTKNRKGHFKAWPRLCEKCHTDASLSQGVIIYYMPDGKPLFWHISCLDELVLHLLEGATKGETK